MQLLKGEVRSLSFGERFRSYSNDYELVVKVTENDVSTIIELDVRVVRRLVSNNHFELNVKD